MRVSSQNIVPVDHSGSITSGGAAQVLMRANDNRQGYWLQNTSSGDLWISDVGTAAAASPSIQVPAGSLYESTFGGCPTTTLSIFGATGGQTFGCREW
jgi:hypothetical protein